MARQDVYDAWATIRTSLMAIGFDDPGALGGNVAAVQVLVDEGKLDQSWADMALSLFSDLVDVGDHNNDVNQTSFVTKATKLSNAIAAVT